MTTTDANSAPISTGKAARIIGVTAATVRAMIARGELPARLVGTKNRIDRADLDAYLERSKVTPTPPAGKEAGK